jgi:preprotein translocase subunit SecF
LIGLASGAYSSIFIASPFLAIFKEREPRYRDIRRRMESRPTGRRAIREIAETEPDADEEPSEVSVGAGAAAAPASRPAPVAGTGRVATNIPPRPRKKGKRR